MLLVERIDQADLQGAGLAGDGEIGGADGAAAFAVAALCDADAGDGEAAARLNRLARHGERRGRFRAGSGSASCSSATSALARCARMLCDVELRMRGDAPDVEQPRRRLAGDDDLVVGAGHHAMRRGQHQIRRNQRCRCRRCRASR